MRSCHSETQASTLQQSKRKARKRGKRGMQQRREMNESMKKLLGLIGTTESNTQVSWKSLSSVRLLCSAMCI